jgi:hypothetical protein
MNIKPDKREERIERFLQAEEDNLKPNFSNDDLAKDILAGNRPDRRRNRLISFSLVGMAACLAFAFLSQFPQSRESGGSLTSESPRQSTELLLDSDKELLEDLLAMPQEMNWGEALPDESTLDLLVMLDQPFE